MVNMTDIFGNALSIAGSFMDSDLVNRFMMVIFAVILVFGVLNCILGYRLLRFWMMLCGFVIGAGIAGAQELPSGKQPQIPGRPSPVAILCGNHRLSALALV